MTSMEAIIHLPGIVLEADGRFPLGPGRVECLPFEQWQMIDDTFAFADRHYSRSRPAFWRGELDVQSLREDALLNAIEPVRERIHTAFLLDPELPCIPHPALSATYIRIQEDESSDVKTNLIKLLGPIEREWIVYGPDISTSFDSARLAQVDRLFWWLEAYQPLSHYRLAAAGLAALERTSRPDNWWGGDSRQNIYDFLACIAACEDLILADDSPGTKVDCFGCHAAALMSDDHGEAKSTSSEWAELYRLRTQLMHGRIGLDDLNKAERRRLPMGRRLLREIILAGLLIGSEKDENSLPSLLSEASKDANAHAALQLRLKQRP